MLDRALLRLESAASTSPRCQAMHGTLIRPRRQLWAFRAVQLLNQLPRGSVRQRRSRVMCFTHRPDGSSARSKSRLKGSPADKSPPPVDSLASATSSFDADALLAEEHLVAAVQPLIDGLSGWRKRWTVVGMCFVAFVLCNLDRVNMSIAILPMAQQYGWGAATMGLVQSSFFWGYLLTQVAGGVLADKLGGKSVLGLGVLWWSLATAATPAAAACGLPTLLAARALMGVGEGVAMPAMNALLAKWVPTGERGRSLALVYSGMFTGSVLGLAASPHILSSFGWPSVFYSFGSLGVIWYLIWQQQVASSPAEDPRVTPEERAFITSNLPPSSQERAGPIPWGALLSRREVWAIILCHFCHNWGLFILLTWMPAYYSQVLGLNLLQSGLVSVLPWLAMALMANVAGALADGMVARGVGVTTVRKVMQSIGFLGPALFLSQLGSVGSAAGAVACMVGAQGLDAFSQAGLYANHQDIGPRYAGVLLGLSNTAGVLAGVVGSLVTGHLLQAAGGCASGATAAAGAAAAEGAVGAAAVGAGLGAGWGQVWGVAVALYLVGTLIWLTMSTGERIFD
ncbi:hypothetical protein Agub_g11299 [Astrephomene gubernaculifera]|uniref:Major facilitator superfamily (MFS) profile domain-containing protein n=1 Tax=Astrephomene gubernaculifera TaxID=47775 RepID=A0AAD3DY37_9CHLO|nr:hypothetical protein Agub_g11299 [Astrephomene gubernaculifera]